MEQILSKLPQSQQFQHKPGLFRLDRDIERTTWTQKNEISIKGRFEWQKRPNGKSVVTKKIIPINCILNSNITINETEKATIKRNIITTD